MASKKKPNKFLTMLSTVIGALVLLIAVNFALAYLTASLLGLGLILAFCLNCAVYIAFKTAKRYAFA